MNENVYKVHKIHTFPHQTSRVDSARYTECKHVGSHKPLTAKDTHTQKVQTAHNHPPTPSRKCNNTQWLTVQLIQNQLKKSDCGRHGPVGQCHEANAYLKSAGTLAFRFAGGVPLPVGTSLRWFWVLLFASVFVCDNLCIPHVIIKLSFVDVMSTWWHAVYRGRERMWKTGERQL